MPNTAELRSVAAALDAQYVVERELGRGGMGVVYLARDRMLDRLVAIKTLPAHIAGDERVRERFVREARTAANLSHPNIVPIHRADEIGGVVFFVMGYVDGESLAERVHAHGPLPPEEAVRYLRDVADALDAAHRRGIVHRDVKAENILIVRATGQAMVTDFGIARVVEAAPMTATGIVLGSVHYMSPEHAMAEAVDARSDVYSLGVVAFHALTARFPFEHESASAVVIAHVTKPAPPVRSLAPSVPPALAAIVDRCLAKDPAARFESCRALREALDAVAPDAVAAALPAPRVGSGRELISDTEAHDLFDRAARAQEGLAVDDAAARRHRAAAPTSGFEEATVREAAREAGIRTAHIDRALADRARGSAAVDTLVDRSRHSHPLAGAPMLLEYELAVDGEMPERDFDRVVGAIRREVGGGGMVTAVGRSLTWSSDDPNHAASVSVTVRDGRTMLVVTQRLKAIAKPVFGGLMGSIGGGVGGVVFGGVMNATNGDPTFGLPAWLAVVATAYGVARFTFGRMVRKRRTWLRGFAEQLAEEIRSTIAERDRSRQLQQPSNSDERKRVR